MGFSNGYIYMSVASGESLRHVAKHVCVCVCVCGSLCCICSALKFIPRVDFAEETTAQWTAKSSSAADRAVAFERRGS